MTFNPKDYYFKKAKKEKFAARSIFKLEEIDQRLKILRPGQIILDLGAAPGSWSQYASKKIGDNGHILGIDLKKVGISLPNAEFLIGDILAMDWASELSSRGWAAKVDVVLSDMAPNTTGIKSMDQAKSYELCEMALTIARQNLKRGGHFVCKLFHGNEFEILRKSIKESFEKVEIVKPQSTRKISKEIFLVGLNFRSMVAKPSANQ